MLLPRSSDLLRLGLWTAGLLWSTGLFAQRERKPIVWDTSYVKDYSQRPTLRIYGSHKFNSFVMHALPDHDDLRFRPNGRYNLGVGVSYRRLTLNIAFPAPFINEDNARYGSTRYLDAQANLYTVRQASNLFLQVFRGYHIASHTPSDLGWEQPTELPYRGDLHQFNVGLSTLRIKNHEHFSYRAAFNQDAWQQRSAGSWLLGGYATCFVLKADSSIVPVLLANSFRAGTGIRSAVIADAGPMLGYAQTFVYRKHWFVTLSSALGAGISVQQLRVPTAEGVSRRTDVGPGWHWQARAAMGYNSAKYYAGVYFNQELVGYMLRVQDRFVWDVGNIRIILAQRINKRPHTVDKGLRWLRSKDPTR